MSSVLRLTNGTNITKPYSLFQAFSTEAKLNWAFIKRDILAIMLPGILFTSRALLGKHVTVGEWALYLTLSALYSWFCLTAFCISNQIVGIEEDRLNKPNRPLVTGAVTLPGAQVRFAVYVVLVLLLGCCLGVVEYSILYLGCTLLHNFQGWGDRWFSKNGLTALGILSSLCASWQMAMPLTQGAWVWIGVIAGSWALLAPLQDLRDIEGDRSTGRNTVPIVLGEFSTRILLCLGFVLMPLVIHTLLIQPRHHLIPLVWDITLATVSWLIAVRVLGRQTPQADRKTYSLFTGWHCLLLLSSFFLMP